MLAKICAQRQDWKGLHEVLNVCATGKTVTEAQARAYQAVDLIRWPEGFCRRDIAWQAIEQEKGSG